MFPSRACSFKKSTTHRRRAACPEGFFATGTIRAMATFPFRTRIVSPRSTAFRWRLSCFLSSETLSLITTVVYSAVPGKSGDRPRFSSAARLLPPEVFQRLDHPRLVRPHPQRLLQVDPRRLQAAQVELERSAVETDPELLESVRERQIVVVERHGRLRPAQVEAEGQQVVPGSMVGSLLEESLQERLHLFELSVIHQAADRPLVSLQVRRQLAQRL